MRKVRDGGRSRTSVQQLPLYNELPDPRYGESPVSSEDPTGKITPEQAQATLKEHGLDVSLEQATAILCYLRRWATITLPQILKK
jgi:hypothetical protein